MTPQLRLATLGATAALVAKFAFHKETHTAIIIGLATISGIAILTAADNPKA